MELPRDYTTESHDEADTGQQELYVALRGAVVVVVGDDERLPLDPEHLVRVEAGTGRALTSGPDLSAQPAGCCEDAFGTRDASRVAVV